MAFKGIGTRDEGKSDYNRILTNPEFYKQLIPAVYIITVQMDNFFRRKIPNEFYVGDYWGNPWAWKQDAPGGGGITVRRITKMIEICEKFQPKNAQDTEDSWISDHIINMGGEFPPLSFRRVAIMESIPVMHPYTWHQFWTFLETYMSMPKEHFISYWEHLLSLD